MVRIKTFSRTRRTFVGWLRQRPKNVYTKRIVRLHRLRPKATLSVLRKLRLKDFDLSLVPWKELTTKQQADREIAVQVLDFMRDLYSLTKGAGEFRANSAIIKKHLGKFIFKKLRKWVAKEFDTIQIELPFKENGEETTIVARNSRDRSKIGRYYNVVKRALDEQDPSPLKEFENKFIVDVDGRRHYYETNLGRLAEIELRKEDPEITPPFYRHG